MRLNRRELALLPRATVPYERWALLPHVTVRVLSLPCAGLDARIAGPAGFLRTNFPNVPHEPLDRLADVSAARGEGAGRGEVPRPSTGARVRASSCTQPRRKVFTGTLAFPRSPWRAHACMARAARTGDRTRSPASAGSTAVL